VGWKPWSLYEAFVLVHLIGEMKPLLKPVELVRGGIALGDRKLSDTMLAGALRRFITSLDLVYSTSLKMLTSVE